jgi:hypothetical protein
MRFHVIAPAVLLARWIAPGADRKAELVIIFAIGAAAFFLVAMAAVIVFLRAGIAREERDQSLLDLPATRASGITRRLVGLHVRSPRYVNRGGMPAGQDQHGQAGHPCSTGGAR